MATYWLEEYTGVNEEGDLPEGPPIVTQSSAFTTEEATLAFNSETKAITVHADAACYFIWGSTSDNPDAQNDSNTIHIPSGVHRSFRVRGGLIGSFWDGSS